MSRYRLIPTPAQETVLRDYRGHARYIWNLAVEPHWHPGRKSAPGYLEQCRQLTAGAEHPWMAVGSRTVQQQTLRDFTQAMGAFFDPENRPGSRRGAKPAGMRGSGLWGAGQLEVRCVSRKTGEVWVPKVGWVKRAGAAVRTAQSAT